MFIEKWEKIEALLTVKQQVVAVVVAVVVAAGGDVVVVAAGGDIVVVVAGGVRTTQSHLTSDTSKVLKKFDRFKGIARTK